MDAMTIWYWVSSLGLAALLYRPTKKFILEQRGKRTAAKLNRQLTENEIKDFCRGQIANHKSPRYVSFVDDYPMTASGKVQKFKLREMAVRELNLIENS